MDELLAQHNLVPESWEDSNLKIWWFCIETNKLILLRKLQMLQTKELPMVVFDLYFVNKEEKEIITYGGVLQSTKSGQTVELVASATLDHALYAYDWCATKLGK